MLPTGHLAAFALAAFALIVIPGPSVLFVIGRSLAHGRRGGLVSVLGNALGMVPQVVAVSLGLGAVVTRSLAVYTAVKLVGAAYVAYLGVQAIRHRRASAQVAVVAAPPRSTRRLLREGFLVGVTNPKSMVFFVAVLPQFAVVERGHLPGQLLVLGLVFLLIGLLSDGTWALVAGTARDWFARSPRRVERMSAAGGVVMVGLGGVLAVSGSQN